MKAICYCLFWFSCLAAPALLSAQRNYAEAMEQGLAAARKGEYEVAIQKYRAAQAFDPTKRSEVDRVRDEAFAGVRRQRDEAVAAKERAQKAEREARQLIRQLETEKQHALAEKDKAQAAENKALAVLEKIYFFEDRFGLAYEHGYYGFIDKNLQVKVPFKYTEALPFDHNGFARVRKGLKYYLIDTLGQEYLLATELDQLDTNVTALDLRRRALTTIPEQIYKNPQLKLLLLDDNQLSSIPNEIEILNRLLVLDLRACSGILKEGSRVYL